MTQLIANLPIDEIVSRIQQSMQPLFVIIHQPTVNISTNQLAYITNNIQYLKHVAYVVEFEVVRTSLLESFRAVNINFAYLGFPCILLFYRQQIVYFDSGALSISGLNELAELAITHFSQQSHFV
jgi:hypothetical protein